MPVMAIGYIPQLLFSRKEIRDAFQVGDDTVTRWIEQGAPIVVEGRGNNVRYCAEVAALQAEGCNESGATEQIVAPGKSCQSP